MVFKSLKRPIQLLFDYLNSVIHGNFFQRLERTDEFQNEKVGPFMDGRRSSRQQGRYNGRGWYLVTSALIKIVLEVLFYKIKRQ